VFVSSYTTYVANNTTDKIQKRKTNSLQEDSVSFNSKLLTKTQDNLSSLSAKQIQLPVNYVSNYKVMNNQQKLQENPQYQESKKTKFAKINLLQNAKSAYAENSILFASLRKPKITLEQRPSLDTRLPTQALQAQEFILKQQMLSTYVENDNYYKITA